MGFIKTFYESVLGKPEKSVETKENPCKNTIMRLFVSEEDIQKNPENFQENWNHRCAHPEGYVGDMLIKRNEYEHTVFHPEDHEHKHGSFFDKCSNPHKYI